MVLDGNDLEVIEACKRGDRDAFRALFETYQDRVYSIALRYSGDRAQALDIAQDVFVKLLNNIGNFRGDAGFETWLYRMVVNRCLDDKRTARRAGRFAAQRGGGAGAKGGRDAAARAARDRGAALHRRAELRGHRGNCGL